ncbi:MAG: trypsin-like peptidase domain-containing protein [Kiritimatiellia bacterium]
MVDWLTKCTMTRLGLLEAIHYTEPQKHEQGLTTKEMQLSVQDHWCTLIGCYWARKFKTMHGKTHNSFLMRAVLVSVLSLMCQTGNAASNESTSDQELRQTVANDMAALTRTRFSRSGGDADFLRSIAATRFISWQKAANVGISEGQTILGLCFDYGIIVTNDTDSAMKLYKLAADKGYAPAQYQLGRCFANPERVGTTSSDRFFDAPPWEKHERKVVAEKIVLGGTPENNLGDNNDLQSRGRVESIKWLRKAADQGYIPAQTELLRCYEFGHGVPKDKTEALNWCRKAADGGDGFAHSILAVAYLEGDGVIQNDVQACFHFLVVGALRDQNSALLDGYAENANKFRANNLSPAEYANAQRMATEWLENFKCRSGCSVTIDKDQSHTNRTLQLLSSGTGFVLSDDGYFLTCAHVVKGSTKLSVLLGGKSYSATLVKADKINDVALLKLAGKGFQTVPIRHELPEMGIKVFTVGYPNPDLQGSAAKYTDGAISALTGIQDDVRTMQITVPVQPGNSGGPLTDEAGNVVGIVEAKMNAAAVFEYTGDIPQNVNFAVKIGYAMPLIQSVSGLSKRLPATREARKGVNIATELEKSTGMVLVYK